MIDELRRLIICSACVPERQVPCGLDAAAASGQMLGCQRVSEYYGRYLGLGRGGSWRADGEWIHIQNDQIRHSCGDRQKMNSELVLYVCLSHV